MARPRLSSGETLRLHVLMPEEIIDAIDDWRFANRFSSRCKAVRKLITLGLQTGARWESPQETQESADTKTFEIEKNVPIGRDTRGGGKIKYPWHEMEIGDSFLVPAKMMPDNPGSLSSAATYAAERLNRKFTTRTQPDGSCRVWRVE